MTLHMKDYDRPFNLIPNMQFNRHNFEEILNFQFRKCPPIPGFAHLIFHIISISFQYHFNIIQYHFISFQYHRLIYIQR